MPPRLFKDAGSSVYAAGGVAFGAQVHAQVISQSGHINFVYVEFTMRTCYELQVYFLQTTPTSVRAPWLIALRVSLNSEAKFVVAFFPTALSS